MPITFTQTELISIQHDVSAHLSVLPSAVDSFMEEHIFDSAHYRIMLDGEYAGFTSVHKANLLTQFVLFPQFRQHGQAIFAQAKRLDHVQAAFVPTCDELYLAHALDHYKQMHKQAYFFATPHDFVPQPVTEYQLQLATSDDIDFITANSGDFFGDVVPWIEQNKILLTMRDAECVGFGVMEKGRLINNIASIGMFVIERFRQHGVGTATIRLLLQHCIAQNLRPIAGCWYYNHTSKKTLERAGMYTQTRLLKVEF
ncbi:MAG: hypothetical protein KAX40_05705 [Herpetosiphon sp.]|nr:hypothetical protein [Herpetosiphon sp.]